MPAETSPNPPPRLIDCFVVRRGAQPEFLVLRRAADRIYAGAWRMVAGKVEPGETAFAGCVRELAEETSLVPSRLWVVPFVHRFYEWQTDQVREISVFLAEVPHDASIRLDGEHDAFAWVGETEALRLLEWPGQRDGLLGAAALLKAPESLLSALEVPARRYALSS